MRKFVSSLRVRLAGLILLATVPVLMGLIWSLDIVASNRLRSAAQQQLEFQTRDLALQVTHWDREAETAVRSLALGPDMAAMNAAQQKPVLEAVTRIYPQISSLQTLRPDGTLVARSDDQPLVQKYGDREWLRSVMAGQPIARQAAVGRQNGLPIVAYAAPIRDSNGEIVGAVSARCELKHLSGVTATENLGQSGYRFVVDERGRVLAHPDYQFVAQLKDIGRFDPVAGLLSGRTSGELRFADDHGDVWLSYAERLPNGWAAISLQQELEILAPVQQYRRYELAGMSAAVLLMAGLTWLVATHLVHPIVHLSEVAGEVAAGRFDRRAEESGNDEVGQLARSFNQMVTKVEGGYRTIEGKVERRTQALRLRNAELLQARQAAEQAARLKDEFLANMSHEIRTPLTAILGYAELLVDLPMSDEDRAKALQSIQYNGQHLLRIINDVLDMAKLDAHKMEVECIDFPPVLLINDVISLMRSKATEKNLQLSVHFASQLPDQIRTDPTRLRQILLNLIGNAIKYTPQGWVRLTVRLIEDTQSQEAMLQFDVADTGIGITEDQMARLFQPFTQGSAATAREYGGSGLGLVISQRLARLLGGDLTVQSTFGEGSIFTFAVPIGRVTGVRMVNPHAQMHDTVAALPFAEDANHKPLTGVRVLVADDTPANTDIISTFLRAAGAEVQVCNNGHQACHETMEAFQSDRAFHLVLMDVQMPEMNGLVATAKLRELGYPGPIIALTASMTETERQQCINAGYNDFVRKPLERPKLIALVAAWSVSPQPAAQGAAPHAAHHARHPSGTAPAARPKPVPNPLPVSPAPAAGQPQRQTTLAAQEADLSPLPLELEPASAPAGREHNADQRISLALK